MLSLLTLIAIPAAAIVYIDFLPVIKEKEYGTIIALLFLLTIAIALASLQVIGFEMPDPLADLKELLPSFLNPIMEFLVPE